MSEIRASHDYLLEKEKLNVVVVGNGGREHAIFWKLSQSQRIGNLSLVPSGTEPLSFARDSLNAVDLAVIGPDNDLAAGIVDRLAEIGVPALGPTRQAARIESSKPFAKQLMANNGVPTAPYKVFSNFENAHQYIEGYDKPVYIKAGGLALGKGARLCLTQKEARKAIDDIMIRKIFGQAGSEVVIEDLLEGEEISLHALCDGNFYRMFPSSQDYKKADDGDQGLNTGGMGAISPVPWFGQEEVDEAGLTIVKPVLEAMHREGNEFSGLLYPGIMVKNGLVNVLEYNARFGDPETQVYMRRLKNDLLEAIVQTLTHRTSEAELEWIDDFAVCIVAASGGYPGPYEKGKRIYGLDKVKKIDGIEVFLSEATEQDGEYFTSGGRVLGVTAVGASLDAALDSGYAAMERIYFDGIKVRHDIGAKNL